MASLSNQYQCIDDSGFTAGPSGGQSGGGSSAPLSGVFTASSIANAVVTAYLIASALQRPVKLVAFGGAPPWTLIAGQAAATGLTGAPSGTAY